MRLLSIYFEKRQKAQININFLGKGENQVKMKIVGEGERKLFRPIQNRNRQNFH